MIFRLFMITLNITVSVILLCSISWFEDEEQKIISINKAHLKDINTLNKIKEINIFLKQNKQLSTIKSETNLQADKQLVKFFDKYSKQYNFKIDRYITQDSVAKYLQIKYKLIQDNNNNFINLLMLDYKSGFLEFEKLDIRDNIIKGQIKLVQLYYGDSNVSKY